VIWQRGGATRRRDDQDVRPTSSAEEIGRVLRSTREERGLDLLAVHDRLDRPITQLEALESGDLAALPDQALALSTLRRYAAFLGLDRDTLALQMIDAWSVAPPPPREGRKAQAGTAPVTTVVTAVTTGPDHLRAFTQTGEVPRVGAGSAAGGSGAYGYGVASGPPTGTFPVVPRQEIRHSKRAVAKARRRLRAPTSLKVVTWLAVVLVLATAVGFGIQRWRPEWLVRSHLLRVASPNHGSSPGAATGGGAPPPASPVVVTSFTNQTAAYSVGAADFTVKIATSGKCWVQVTSANSQTPLVSGIQPAGEVLTYPAQGTMTVEVGASAVLVGISIKGKAVYINSPHTTPFTYTFTPSSSP
jgi:Helix-turn-helix domain/Domain of unknown function (DUF4115)